MDTKNVPGVFEQLRSKGCITASDIVNTQDGFWMICKSLSDILAEKGILDFPGSGGTRLACNKFFDDWFLYAVPSESDSTYSLLKLREQEHDLADHSPADGDTPGVTISFISFASDALLGCLDDPADEKRQGLACEINRVVAYRGQRHHNSLKRYFVNPKSQGAYLVADLYIKHVASFAENGMLHVPDYYKEISVKSSARLPRFVHSINQAAGYVVCDNGKIYIKNKDALTEYERAVILATHTGNTSEYSFAAEVEFHARFLTIPSKIKIPFFGKSIYDSAVRADMTVDDKEFDLSAPFYRANSKIVKRQYTLHGNNQKR